jgi:lysyl-tRNA synthetase class I
MKTSTKIIKKVADGYCPNANCDLDGDIEQIKTEYEHNGEMTVHYKCSCGTKWYLKYEAYAINVFTQPDNFKLIEGD